MRIVSLAVASGGWVTLVLVASTLRITVVCGGSMRVVEVVLLATMKAIDKQAVIRPPTANAIFARCGEKNGALWTVVD